MRRNETNLVEVCTYKRSASCGICDDMIRGPAGVVCCVNSGERRKISDDSYLVDPASSHMLVSKIKPCMS